MVKTNSILLFVCGRCVITGEITLVKGCYRPSVEGNLSIGAVFIGSQQPVDPPCIVAEFTNSCQLQRIVTHGIARTELTAINHPLGYLLSIDDFDLLFTCYPATVMSGEEFVELRRPTFVVAVADLVDTVWHDGILAHVEQGRIFSLVNSVGNARLTVPLRSTTGEGIAPCQLPRLDQGEHARACLTAIFSHQWSVSPPSLYLDQFDLSVAVCLAVASSLDVTGINVIVEQKNLTRQWRRFLQNIGAQPHREGNVIAVSQLVKFVTDAQLIAETINRRAMVIPVF